MVEQEKLSAVLIEFAHTLVTDFPIQAILDRLAMSIVDVLDIAAAGVTLISTGGTPHYVAASSLDALELEQLQTALRQGPCLTAHATGEPVAVPDLSADEDYPEFSSAARAAGVAATFAFPLRHAATRIGALDLYRTTTGPLDPRDVAAAQTLADVTAAYLINAQARQDAQDVSNRFEHAASHDALTGLPNRIMLERRMVEAAEREGSHGAAAVLFADVDKFKAVNDTYGHFVGDALLVAVAGRLSRSIRPGDTLARVSGDEFVIFCEDLTDPSDAQHLAARIQLSLAEPFELPSVTVRITVSIGIAFAGPGERTSARLIRDADMAMYEAKDRGGATYQTLSTRASRHSAW